MSRAPSTEPPLGVTKPISEETVTDADDAADEEPDENEILALWGAVREGDKPVIDEMLVGDEEHPPITGASVDMVDESGMTILHWLTVEGHASVRAQPAPPLPCAATRPAVADGGGRCSVGAGGAVADRRGEGGCGRTRPSASDAAAPRRSQGACKPPEESLQPAEEPERRRMATCCAAQPTDRAGAVGAGDAGAAAPAPRGRPDAPRRRGVSPCPPAPAPLLPPRSRALRG